MNRIEIASVVLDESAKKELRRFREYVEWARLLLEADAPMRMEMFVDDDRDLVVHLFNAFGQPKGSASYVIQSEHWNEKS